MKKEIVKKILRCIIITGCCLILFLGVVGVFFSGTVLSAYFAQRGHWNVETSRQMFMESSKKISNPNRGFYNIYGFVISDEKQNYNKLVSEKLCNDEYSLSMIQINLRNYMDGSITEIGLENVDRLFEALQREHRQYIIRFLYDWGGLEEKKEPADIQIILSHMEQLGAILENYSQIIFTFQGIFVGPCAEMHSSAYIDKENMMNLMQQFMKSTPEKTFLSVRTPQQWRILTGISEKKDFLKNELSRRLGLFNDGIMGTTLDTGTYGDTSKEDAGPYGKWTREEELAFQEELCKLVPNGGEVIIENPINDFENAVDSLATMHVTYLNRAYDQNVLNKWAESIVAEDGCFYGMDGLSYIEHHLGYRLLIEDVLMDYDFWPDKLDISVRLKNVGFAPLYKKPEAYFVIQNKDTGVITTYPIDAEVCSLSGGNNKEDLLPVAKSISLAGFDAGEYEVYFYLLDADSGWRIEFANEQELQEQGYFLGGFTIGELRNPFTGEPLNLGENIGDFLNRVSKKHQKEEK